MAALLDRVKPLAHLLSQADDPITLAERLADQVIAGAAAPAISALVRDAVTDAHLVTATLTYAGVVDTRGELSPHAAVAFGQAAALLAAAAESGHRLVLTVPAFLTESLTGMVRDLPANDRPIDTVRAMRETAAAAGPRLQIAAPFLHTGFIGLLAANVGQVLKRGGRVQLLTRALSMSSPQRSSANVDVVTLLRDVAVGKPGTLEVHSWEESGLGIHLKVVLAHRDALPPVAYIGSSNPTPGGTLGHAEAGLLAHGPTVLFLSRWLDATAEQLRARRR